MDEGITIRVWDDRDEAWWRRFSVTLPDGTRRPVGMRLADLRAQAEDGVYVLRNPFREEPTRIPLGHWAGDDSEHTFLGIGFETKERRGPPPGATSTWSPPPPPPGLQALFDELRPLQAQFRRALDLGDEVEQERLLPLIDAQWERIEAHPAHTGWRENRAEQVEIEPGIRVWDTRRTS